MDEDRAAGRVGDGESPVTVAGVELTPAQVTSLRCAVTGMILDLQDAEKRRALGPIADGYESRLREVEWLLVTRRSASRAVTVEDKVEAIRLRTGLPREEFERMTVLEVAARLADAGAPVRSVADRLLDEIVDDSDQCPGCGHLYAVPERREPSSDRWAWRKCPTRGCRHHGATVSYSRDWIQRARRRIADLVTALNAVGELR